MEVCLSPFTDDEAVLDWRGGMEAFLWSNVHVANAGAKL